MRGKKLAIYLDFVQRYASKLFRVFPSCGLSMRQSLVLALILVSLTVSGCCNIGGCPASGFATGTEDNPDGLISTETTEIQAVATPVSTAVSQEKHNSISSRKRSAKIEPYSWNWLAQENARKRAESARISRLLTICQDCRSDASSR
jgi:hypothetical protein